MQPVRTVLTRVGVVAAVVGFVGCADDDGPQDEITRIDGPAVVDEDELDG